MAIVFHIVEDIDGVGDEPSPHLECLECKDVKLSPTKDFYMCPKCGNILLYHALRHFHWEVEET